jgi:hypothetical protein
MLTTIGHYRVGFFHIDEVTNAGSSVDMRPHGFSRLIFVTGTPQEEEVALTICPNSATLSSTEDDLGRFFIITSAGTHDVLVMVVGTV